MDHGQLTVESLALQGDGFQPPLRFAGLFEQSLLLPRHAEPLSIAFAVQTQRVGVEFGDVEALEAKIYGSVQGFAFIEDVTVGTTGQVIGSLQYKTIAVEAGALLDAEIRKIAPVEVASAEPGPAELAAQPSGSASERVIPLTPALAAQ